jgi:hypothetical protein
MWRLGEVTIKPFVKSSTGINSLTLVQDLQKSESVKGQKIHSVWIKYLQTVILYCRLSFAYSQSNQNIQY